MATVSATTTIVTRTTFLPGDPRPTTTLVFSTTDRDDIADWLDEKQHIYETTGRDSWGTLRGPDTLVVTSVAGQTTIWRALEATSDQIQPHY